MARTRAANYDPETIELALVTLALAGGNSGKASRMLAATDVKVPGRTLHDWRNRYAERYAEIAETSAREIERSVVHKARELAIGYSDLEAEAIEATRVQLRNGELRDASTAARNAAIGKGISIEKMLLLEGRPTEVVEQRSMDDVIHALRQVGAIIESTAVEEPAPAALPPAAS